MKSLIVLCGHVDLIHIAGLLLSGCWIQKKRCYLWDKYNPEESQSANCVCVFKKKRFYYYYLIHQCEHIFVFPHQKNGTFRETCEE